MPLLVKRTKDFEFAAKDDKAIWDKADWVYLNQVGGDLKYETKFKILYSDKGIYFNIFCEDNKISCTGLQDFDNLYKEDVVEIFLKPEMHRDVYFEYELSPMDSELPLMVASNNGKCKHECNIIGINGDKCNGWICHIFIPFELLEGLVAEPPTSGKYWLANVCRIDYDSIGPSRWTWCDKIGTEFHNTFLYDRIVFE